MDPPEAFSSYPLINTPSEEVMFSGARKSPLSPVLPAAYTTWALTTRKTPVSTTTQPADRSIARSGRNTSAPPLSSGVPQTPHHQGRHTGTGGHQLERGAGQVLVRSRVRALSMAFAVPLGGARDQRATGPRGSGCRRGCR